MDRADVHERELSSVEITELSAGLDGAREVVGFRCIVEVQRHDGSPSGPQITIEGSLELSGDTPIRECERAVLIFAAALLKRAACFDPDALQEVQRNASASQQRT